MWMALSSGRRPYSFAKILSTQNLPSRFWRADPRAPTSWWEQNDKTRANTALATAVSSEPGAPGGPPGEAEAPNHNLRVRPWWKLLRRPALLALGVSVGKLVRCVALLREAPESLSRRNECGLTGHLLQDQAFRQHLLPRSPHLRSELPW